MKRCPECRRDYYDETLLYCLDDGNALLDGPASWDARPGTADEPATAILPLGVSRSGGPSSEEPTRAQMNPTDETAILPTGTGEVDAKAAIWNKALLAVAILSLAIVGGFLAYEYVGTKDTQIESIAVMPFVNESGNADVEYLSDGITETLIKSLSQVPNLAVKSRSTVFYYKGKEITPARIGEELKVQAVLLGRVGGRGHDLKLSLELVNTQSQDVTMPRMQAGLLRRHAAVLSRRRQSAARERESMDEQTAIGSQAGHFNYGDDASAPINKIFASTYSIGLELHHYHFIDL